MGFAVCLNNSGYVTSLELRKLYELLPDENAMARGMLRVVDESGCSYLYPSAMFAPLQLPEDLETAIKSSSAMRVRVEFITAFLSCVLEICFISSPREKKWMWVRHVGVIEKPSLRRNK